MGNLDEDENQDNCHENMIDYKRERERGGTLKWIQDMKKILLVWIYNYNIVYYLYKITYSRQIILALIVMA